MMITIREERTEVVAEKAGATTPAGTGQPAEGTAVPSEVGGIAALRYHETLTDEETEIVREARMDTGETEETVIEKEMRLDRGDRGQEKGMYMRITMAGASTGRKRTKENGQRRAMEENWLLKKEKAMKKSRRVDMDWRILRDMFQLILIAIKKLKRGGRKAEMSRLVASPIVET